MDERFNQSEISNAICEPNLQNRSDRTYVQQNNHINPYNTTTATNKIQMNLNPRYISKISNSPRKIRDTSLRMRPYFIPERSRTKSENADHHEHYYFCSGAVIGSNGIIGGAGVTTVQTTAAATTTTATTTMMDTSGDPAAHNNILSDLSYANSAVHGLINCGSGNCTSGSSCCSNNNTKAKKLALKKKSRSLEDVRAENLDGSLPSHEMEFVSNRIQKLRMQD